MNLKKRYGLSGLLLGIASLLHANPESPTVVSGDVSFNQPDAYTLEVSSSSSRSIVDWETFSISANQTTSFNLPSSSSAILNRVTSSSVSNILGTLQSNGQVYLINPNGILFGPDSIVDTGSFLASTLDCDNTEFLNGGEMTFTGTEDTDIYLTHYGSITANDGDVVLLSYQVLSQGDILAENGTVAIGGGVEVILTPTDEQRIAVVSHSAFLEPAIGLEVGGFIQSVTAELKADGNLYQLAIKHDGWIDAHGVAAKDAHVRFVAENGSTLADGLITAIDQVAAGTGGRVDITGQDVELGSSCYVTVTAPYGQGEIFVGGGFQGNDPDLINAQNTFVDASAYLDASALYYGEGGLVVVWADDTTDFQGTIVSMGGQYSGDGGLVEVSGVQCLSFTGTVDVSSPTGEEGVLLLDPLVLDYRPANRPGYKQATPRIVPST